VAWPGFSSSPQVAPQGLLALPRPAIWGSWNFLGFIWPHWGLLELIWLSWGLLGLCWTSWGLLGLTLAPGGAPGLVPATRGLLGQGTQIASHGDCWPVDVTRPDERSVIYSRTCEVAEMLGHCWYAHGWANQLRHPIPMAWPGFSSTPTCSTHVRDTPELYFGQSKSASGTRHTATCN